MAKKIAKNKKTGKKIIATKKAVKQKNKKILKAKLVKKIASKKKLAKPVKVKKLVKKAVKISKKKVVLPKKKKTSSVPKSIKKNSPKKIAKTEKKIAKIIEIKNDPIKIAKTLKIEKKEKKQSKKSQKPQKMKSVFIIKNEILNLKPNPAKSNKKEPKGKYTLEYVVNCSPPILYEFLTTPSGLSEWFADDVNIRDDKYSFIWDGGEQTADILEATPNKVLRLKWSDRNDGTYFQFSIEQDDLTNDVSLIITDFSENEAEQKSSQMLWDSQVHKLLQVIGS